MTSPKPTTIDEYIATLSDDRAAIVQKIRETVRRVLPDATETMSYGMPTFDLNNHHLVYFSAWKDHIGIYPLYTDGGELKELFGPYNKVNNSIRVPYDDPKLYEIVEKFSLFRQKEEAANPSHH
jgi:uncharacterized protein YdhG (YjbR/CyaY superfamily)